MLVDSFLPINKKKESKMMKMDVRTSLAYQQHGDLLDESDISINTMRISSIFWTVLNATGTDMTHF